MKRQLLPALLVLAALPIRAELVDYYPMISLASHKLARGWQ